MNIEILKRSPIIIPLLISILVLAILLLMYKFNKLDKQVYSLLTIGLISATVFIISWFICDTYMYNKEILYNNIHQNNINQLESESSITNNRKKNTKLAKDIKLDKNIKKSETINETSEIKPIKNNKNIKIILQEPLNQIPEYKYMTTGNVQIPEDVDLYLDRGKI